MSDGARWCPRHGTAPVHEARSSLDVAPPPLPACFQRASSSGPGARSVTWTHARTARCCLLGRPARRHSPCADARIQDNRGACLVSARGRKGFPPGGCFRKASPARGLPARRPVTPANWTICIQGAAIAQDSLHTLAAHAAHAAHLLRQPSQRPAGSAAGRAGRSPLSAVIALRGLAASLRRCPSPNAPARPPRDSVTHSKRAPYDDACFPNNPFWPAARSRSPV